MCGQTSKIQAQVSQQVANLPRELTYTNNTSNAQIQISPLGYNLGYRAQRAREKERKTKGEKGRKGDSGWREKSGRRLRGERLLYLNSHIRPEYHLNTNTFTGGTWTVRDLHVFLTYLNPWLSSGGSQILAVRQFLRKNNWHHSD